MQHVTFELKADASWIAGESLWCISDRAKHSPYYHVPDRRIHNRPCRSGGHLPAYTRLDDRGNAGGTEKPNMNGLRRMPVVKQRDIKPELRQLQRRAFLRNTLSLGGLALLTGCELSTNSGVDAALKSILRFDDRVQAALFSARRLAQTYPSSAVI